MIHRENERSGHQKIRGADYTLTVLRAVVKLRFFCASGGNPPPHAPALVEQDGLYARLDKATCASKSRDPGTNDDHRCQDASL
jgi:hypothetical protein